MANASSAAEDEECELEDLEYSADDERELPEDLPAFPATPEAAAGADEDSLATDSAASLDNAPSKSSQSHQCVICE